MGASALAGIFAFRVFSHDDPVEVLGRSISQGAGNTREDAGRPDIGVLIQGLADGQS